MTTKQPAKKKAASKKAPSKKTVSRGAAKRRDEFDSKIASSGSGSLTVRRMHRRDINRVWEFLKRSFRDVNRETVEYQRPRSKERFGPQDAEL